MQTGKWTETDLEALTPQEHDFQEFKCSRYMIHKDRIAPDFVAALSKQISAFANGAGGRIFLGIDDDGLVDGGLPTDAKGGGTRAWLEDVIPDAVDPRLKAFNVYEVLPRKGGPSRIEPGHAVYVIDIEPSEDAPHQAIDYRYYLRIAGKSRPMGNLHIHDVLQRTRHPRVDITRVGPYGKVEYIDSDPRGPKAIVCFQAFLTNQGKRLAQHVGAEIILPRPLVNRKVRSRMLGSPNMRLTQRPGTLMFFRYHPNPLFPGQEIFLLRFWVALHEGNLERVRSGEGKVRWRVYADDAPPKEGSEELARFSVVREAVAWLEARI